MDTQLKEYAKTHAWAYQMQKSQGLDSYDNYSGPDLGDMVVVCGRNRDSDILTESNFNAALDLLGGESKNVKVERFGHWGCGWLELILVNPKSLKHLKIAYDISKRLADYPVLDESDYSNRQCESYSDFSKDHESDIADALEKHFKVKKNKALVRIAYDLNMECQYQGGEDACINIYTMRQPDASDLKDLKDCLESMAYQYKRSRTFKALVGAVNAYQVKA